MKNARIKMITYFSWDDFDRSVEHIANKCKFLEFSGIYGVPRGGLSRCSPEPQITNKFNFRTNKKFPNSNDVYETGITLNNFKNIEEQSFCTI